MCSVTQAIDLLNKGHSARCEFRRSINDEGYLNVVILVDSGEASEIFIIEKNLGEPLNLLDYDNALEVALKIGFSFEQMKVNIQ